LYPKINQWFSDFGVLPVYAVGQRYQVTQAAVYMNTDIVLDELVTPDKYPYCHDGRQQNRQTPQKIAFEASGYHHFSEQQVLRLPLPTSPCTMGLRRVSGTRKPVLTAK
jgi:hypothetical protein